MNTSLPEMLHYLNTTENFNTGGGAAKMSVLERQQEQLQQPPILSQLIQQLPMDYFSSDAQLSVFSAAGQPQHFQDFSNDQNLGGRLLIKQAMKSDHGCTSFGFGNLEMNDYAVARTASCPPAVVAAAAAMAEVANGKESVLPEKLMSSIAGKESFKKRKADKNQNSKAATKEEESTEKKSKGNTEEKDAKLPDQRNNNNKKELSDASKDNSKVSEVKKPDYIHVRARRGQATDSHSLAERVRREKISERMKYLQDLVPGCNKITGKAGMLDEIINYVQSLQRQVEFLSMKLAAVNPRLDFNIDNLIFPATTPEFHTIGGAASEINIPATYPSDSLQHIVSCCGLEMGVEPSEMVLRRTLSAPVSIPEALTESPCFDHIQPSSTWDAELQSLYGMEFQQARSSLLSQPCTGFIGGGNVKMEM